MRFGSDFIERVREASSLAEIISQDSQLKGGGGRYMGLCPFPDHKEKSPSFSVSEDKQVYHCFGCKKSGDIFTYLEIMRGMSFPESVEYLAKRGGIEIPQELKNHVQNLGREDERKALYSITELAAERFCDLLNSQPLDHPIWRYLESRQLNTEIIRKFQIGLSSDSWDDLVRIFQSRKIPLSLPLKLGLIRERAAPSQGHYDLFRGRLMFPILSPTNQVIGFGGRVLGDELPKYINSTDSPIFHKGKTFYGLHETAKFIRSLDQVLILEGYMDFLALFARGIQNVAATLGTAFTIQHANLLKRYTRNVILLYDGDSAGKEGAFRALPLLLQAGIIPKAIFLDENLDPDDFVKKFGVAALKEKINSARELFLLLLDDRLKGYQGSAGEKIQLLDELGPILKLIPDKRLHDLYKAELQERLGVTPAWIASALTQIAPKPLSSEGDDRSATAGTQTPAPPVSAPELNKKVFIEIKDPPKAEVFLLNLALHRREFLDQTIASGILGNSESGVSELTNDGIRQVFNRVAEIYRHMPNEFDSLTALLMREVNPPSWVSQHLEKSYSELELEKGTKLVGDCIEKIRQSFYRDQKRQLASNMKGLSPQDQLKKLEQIMNIHQNSKSRRRDKNV